MFTRSPRPLGTCGREIGASDAALPIPSTSHTLPENPPSFPVSQLCRGSLRLLSCIHTVCCGSCSSKLSLFVLIKWA